MLREFWLYELRNALCSSTAACRAAPLQPCEFPLVAATQARHMKSMAEVSREQKLREQQTGNLH